MMVAPHAKGTCAFPQWLVEATLQAATSLPSAPSVFGISGVQGSGKSTLAKQVATLAQGRGLQVAVLSLDDFYLTRHERRLLADRVHPLFATRGPPGTHDLALAMDVIHRLRRGDPLRLPRFDKRTDDRMAESTWPRFDSPADLVLLEGWMLGVPAQEAWALETPVNALERTEDPAAAWRTWCNRALADAYPALWECIDALWLLQAPSFEIVPHWRWQQEQSLWEGLPGHPGMARAHVERFVQLFERVSRHALDVLPPLAQEVVQLDESRTPARDPPNRLTAPRN